MVENLEKLSRQQEALSDREIGELAKKLLKKIKKVQWTNEQIEENLARRTIDEICNSGETFFMGACIDTTLAFLMEIKNKIPAGKLEVCCEHLCRDNTGNHSFHLFLKDYSKEPTRIIDFTRKNHVRIYQGSYNNPLENKGVQRKGLYQLSADKINKSDSFLTIAEKMGISLPPELFNDYIGYIQSINTTATFNTFQQKSDIKIDIRTPEGTSEKLYVAIGNEDKKRKAD